MALKDKVARAAYNRAYRARRAAELPQSEKDRLRERHRLKLREYAAQGYDTNASGPDRRRMREPRSLAEWSGALRWDVKRYTSRMDGWVQDGMRGLLLSEKHREELASSIEVIDRELEQVFDEDVDRLAGIV